MDGAHHVDGSLPGTEFDVAIDSFGTEWLRTGPVRQAIRHGNRGGAGRPTAGPKAGWGLKAPFEFFLCSNSDLFL